MRVIARVAATFTTIVLPLGCFTTQRNQSNANHKRVIVTWAFAMAGQLVFFLNGARIEINGADGCVDPDMSLLTFIRGQGLTGSKLGCGEVRGGGAAIDS